MEASRIGVIFDSNERNFLDICCEREAGGNLGTPWLIVFRSLVWFDSVFAQEPTQAWSNRRVCTRNHLFSRAADSPNYMVQCSGISDETSMKLSLSIHAKKFCDFLWCWTRLDELKKHCTFLRACFWNKPDNELTHCIWCVHLRYKPD